VGPANIAAWGLFPINSGILRALPMDTPIAARLAPLPYHLALIQHLRSSEPGLWAWFANSRIQAESAERMRLELLRTTVRLGRETYPELYAQADEVARALELTAPITLYQAQAATEPNAALFYVPGQVHLVFSGPILTRLEALEQRALLAHELAHYLLWEREERQLLTASALLGRAVDSGGEASLAAAHQTFHQLVEVFCDRASALVCGDFEAAIRCLVKVETGLAVVSAKDYLAQAEELLGKGEVLPAGLSHPEAFIRVRALALWWNQEADAEARIERLVKGPLELDRLDLLDQVALTRATGTLLGQLLEPGWVRTEAVLGHAGLFLEGAAPSVGRTPEVAEEALLRDSRLASYWASVAMDFALVDPQLGDPGLAQALAVAGRYGFDQAVEELAFRDAKVTKKALAALKQRIPELLEKAAAEARAS